MDYTLSLMHPLMRMTQRIFQRIAVMSHNRPSWVAEEPSKTGRSAVQGFGTTRQNGAFCLVFSI
jgi:hypothetical protein